MRMESVSLVAAIALGSGLAYAWWVGRKRHRGTSLEREGVAGRAVVTSVTGEAGGEMRVAWRFRHPFTGANHDGSATLPADIPAPAVGEEVDIAYLPDAPDVSCLTAKLARQERAP